MSLDSGSFPRAAELPTPHNQSESDGLSSGGGPHPLGYDIHAEQTETTDSGGGSRNRVPESRWPSEAGSWNGAKRQEFAKQIEVDHPEEDPEYGMPD